MGRCGSIESKKDRLLFKLQMQILFVAQYDVTIQSQGGAKPNVQVLSIS